MANRYAPPKENKITQNFSRYYSADPNYGYSMFQNEAQNVSNGMFYETSLGRLIINQLTTKVIGKGLVPMAAPETAFLGWTPEETERFQRQAESLYRLIANNPSIDWLGKMDIPMMQQTMFRMILINGDVLLHRGYKKRNGIVLPYVQIISGKLIGNPNGASDTKDLVGGVALDANGIETGYYIMVVDQNRMDSFEYRYVSRFNARTKRKDFDLIQLYAADTSQVRGIPYLMTLRDDILQITKLKDLHLTKAMIQNLFTIFIEKSQDNPGEESFQEKVKAGLAGPEEEIAPEEGAPDYTLGGGAVIEGNPGEKFNAIESKMNADDFATSMKTLLSIIAASAGLSYEELLSSYDSSFSASRATINSSEKFYKTLRDEFTKKACKPIYDQIVDYGINAGLIDAPGYFDSELKKRAALACTWTGATPTQVDPVKEVTAYIDAINAGLCTREYATRNLFGLDHDEVVERRVQEDRKMSELQSEGADSTGNTDNTDNGNEDDSDGKDEE